MFVYLQHKFCNKRKSLRHTTEVMWSAFDLKQTASCIEQGEAEQQTDLTTVWIGDHLERSQAMVETWSCAKLDFILNNN